MDLQKEFDYWSKIWVKMTPRPGYDFPDLHPSDGRRESAKLGVLAPGIQWASNFEKL
jgi:hypothetical protein